MGTKRTGYLCLREFVARNGYEWHRSDDDETVAVIEGLAAGTVSERSLQRWIEQRLGMATAARWKIGDGDFVRYRGLGTMEGLFNRLMLLFTNAETGEVDHVIATDSESAERVGVFEKFVKARHRKMTTAEAQARVERWVSVLGGGAPVRWFVTLRADRELSTGVGATRAAAEIDRGDSIELEVPGAPNSLDVYGVS
jgi:hypothetical protein